MTLPLFPLRPAAAAVCSLLVSFLFVGLAVLREDIAGGIRAGWWVIAAVWLGLAAYYGWRAVTGRARHAAQQQPAPAPHPGGGAHAAEADPGHLADPAAPIHPAEPADPADLADRDRSLPPPGP